MADQTAPTYKLYWIVEKGRTFNLMKPFVHFLPAASLIGPVQYIYVRMGIGR